MTVFFVMVMSFYFFSLIVLIIGWRKGLSQSYASNEHKIFISIIVPFRNEASRISNLILSLNKLNYPAARFEVIFINDHSEDESAAIVDKMITEHGNFILIHATGHGKKQAITEAINLSQGEIIATTDADCTAPIEWLSIVNRQFQDQDTQLIFGGVRLTGSNKFFTKLQELEWTSLMGITASSLAFNFFIMGNAANMAYRKSAFLKVEGYKGNESIPSGDDEFLARKIKVAYQRSVRFIASRDFIVTTEAQDSFRKFIDQRIRWAGKWRFNKSLTIKWLAVVVPVIQVSYLVLIVSTLSREISLEAGSILILIKILLELLLLYPIARFLKSNWNWAAFLLLQLIYPIYVLGVGVASLSGSYEWKGRRLFNKM